MSARVLIALICSLFLASASNATTVYGDYFGTDFDFLGLQETSTFGDPLPLYGAPIAGPGNVLPGNNLLFFSTNFSANSVNGTSDFTGSQLQTTIMSTGDLFIDQIEIEEFGDANLQGIGTAATGVFMALAGVVTVLETDSGACVGAQCQITFTGVFGPSDLLTLPSDPGLTIWTGLATIDIASVVPDATKVVLSLNNDLFAFSEAGTSALVQKKVTNGVIINVVPEPGTGTLLALGLLGMGIRSRRNRGQIARIG